MSDEPHLRAYLCDDCWNKVPHFIVAKPKVKKQMNKKEEEDSRKDSGERFRIQFKSNRKGGGGFQKGLW